MTDTHALPRTYATIEEPAIISADTRAAELIDEQGLPPPRQPDFGSAVRWNFVGTLLRVGMTVVSQMLLLRIVGPAIAGQNAIFMIIVGIGSILSEGGMLAALMRVPEITHQVLRNAIFLILVYAGTVTFGLLLASRLLVRLFALPETDLFIPLVAALNVIPLALSSVPTSVLKRNYRAKEIQIIQIAAYFIGFLCVGLPIALLHPSVIALMAAFSLQTGLTVVALWIAAHCPLLPLARGAGQIRGTSLKGLTANVSYFINESIAYVGTAHFMGTYQVGLYGTSANLGRLPTDALINTMHGPLMVSAARGEQEVPGRFLNAMNAVAVVVVPAYLVASLCAKSVLLPLLGDKWLNAWPVFAAVVLAMLLRLIGMLSSAILWGKGALWADIGSQWLALAGFLLLFTIFHPQNAEQVAVLSLAAWSARTVLQVGVAARVLAVPVSRMARSLFGPAIVSILFVLPLRWLHGQFGMRPTLSNLFFLAIAALVLFAVRLAVAIRLDGDSWSRMAALHLPLPLRSRLQRPAAALR